MWWCGPSRGAIWWVRVIMLKTDQRGEQFEWPTNKNPWSCWEDAWSEGSEHKILGRKKMGRDHPPESLLTLLLCYHTFRPYFGRAIRGIQCASYLTSDCKMLRWGCYVLPDLFKIYDAKLYRPREDSGSFVYWKQPKSGSSFHGVTKAKIWPNIEIQRLPALESRVYRRNNSSMEWRYSEYCNALNCVNDDFYGPECGL